MIPVKLKISYAAVFPVPTDPPDQRIVLVTLFNLTALHVLTPAAAAVLLSTIKLKVSAWLSKLEVGIPVTLKVISPVGLVQYPMLAPPEL